jgi:hypothetical protein
MSNTVVAALAESAREGQEGRRHAQPCSARGEGGDTVRVLETWADSGMIYN